MVQLLFGRYFWVWVLGFLGTASYLSALSINELLRLSMSKEYKLPALSGQSSISEEPKIALSAITRGCNLFDPKCTPIEPPKKSKQEAPTETRPQPKKIDVYGCPAISPDQKIPESKVGSIRLKGTSYAEKDPGQSVAAVYVKVTIKETIATPTRALAPVRPRPRPRYSRRDYRYRLRRRPGTLARAAAAATAAPVNLRTRTRTKWQTEVFRVGDEMMDDLRLCAVGPKEIVFYNQKTRAMEKLVLEPKKKKALANFFGTIGIAMQKENSGNDDVRVDAIDKRTISRATVQGWLQNPMAHAMSARIMPHFEGGRSNGLRLVWVRNGSLYSQLGLKTGDVVQSINGKTLNVSNALGLYSQLPFAKNLRVNVVRQGVRRQLFFNIK